MTEPRIKYQPQYKKGRHWWDAGSPLPSERAARAKASAFKRDFKTPARYLILTTEIVEL